MLNFECLTWEGFPDMGILKFRLKRKHTDRELWSVAVNWMRPHHRSPNPAHIRSVKQTLHPVAVNTPGKQHKL